MNFSLIPHFENKLKEISSILINEEDNNIGVLGGISGVALFLFHYSEYTKNSLYSKKAKKHIENIIDLINSENTKTTFCDGIAGALWTLDFLEVNKFIDFNIDRNVKVLDEYLFEVMLLEISNKNYDFLHGGLGYGFYFLERYRNTKKDNLAKLYLEYIETFIKILDKIAISTNEFVYWEDYKSTENKSVNFGLAHGLPSIVYFLTKIREYNIISPIADKLLSKLSYYIISISKMQNLSAFPSYICLDGCDQITNLGSEISRLAWCYGDLTLAYNLYRANLTELKSRTINNICCDILIKSSSRKLPEESMVKDAGVCHGSFGLALIFKRCYEMTGIAEMKDAYVFWLNDGLCRAYHQNGYAGFSSYKEDSLFQNKINVLDGISGIGLVMITSISKKRLTWDRCLMMN